MTGKTYYSKNKERIQNYYYDNWEYFKEQRKKHKQYTKDCPRLFREYIRELLKEYEENNGTNERSNND